MKKRFLTASLSAAFLSQNMKYFVIILFALSCLLSAVPSSSAATRIFKTVKPYGGDNIDLASCLRDNEQDLVTGDCFLDIEISGDWSSRADTTTAVVENYTTDATHYISIYTTGAARHNGVWDASKYRIDTPNYSERALDINQNVYIRVSGLQILWDGSENADRAAIQANYIQTNSDVRISQCIIKSLSVTNNQAGIQLNTASNPGNDGIFRVWDNIIYGFNLTSSRGIHTGANGYFYVYNNTVYGNTIGIVGGNTNAVAKNNICTGNTTDFSGTFSDTSTNNLSQDGTAPAYNTYYTSRIPAFASTASGNENFHLVNVDTSAVNCGANLASDANIPFDYDIEGQLRSSENYAWDIGADEYCYPFKVANLQATAGAQITLQWSASENGFGARCGSYLVKYSTTANIVTNSDFVAAATYYQSWNPETVGTVETKILTGLIPDTTYWFSIKGSSDTTAGPGTGLYAVLSATTPWKNYAIASNWMLWSEPSGNSGPSAFIAWGDFDNDGDLDLAINGSDGIGSRFRIYRNDGGTFNLHSEPAGGIGPNSAMSWGDFDNDGDLDLAVIGLTGWPNRKFAVYRNDNSVFNLHSEPAGAAGLAYGFVDWGDFDNDGDLDLAVNGFDGTENRFRVYRNDNGVFNLHSEPEGDIGPYGSLAWGDFDNDGDLDLAGNGYHALTGIYGFRVYSNDNGTLNLYDSPLERPSGGVAWGDFDNDGDLDIAACGYDGTRQSFKIYKSLWADFRTQNTAPSVPGNLDKTYSIDDTNNDTLTLTWDKSTDDKTTDEGLYYNIRVATRTIVNGLDKWVVSPSTGAGTPSMGNYSHGYIVASSTQAGLIFKPPLFGVTYYWQVQAIDTSLKRSAWSVEQSYYVPLPPPFKITNLQAFKGSQLILQWSSPDNGAGAKCGSYLVKYSTTANIVTNSDFVAAATYYQSWNPETVGTVETKILTGLIPDLTYWFSIKGSSISISGTTAWAVQSSTGTNSAVAGCFMLWSEPAGVVGPADGSVAWGDYDNDGDLDLAVNGYDGTARRFRVYRNDSGTFNLHSEPAGATGPGDTGSVAWGDFDNDGDLDLAVNGHDGSGYRFRVYRNDNGTFNLHSEPAGATGPDYSVAWGDFDNDGDLDIAVIGADMFMVYRNDNGTFNLHQGLAGLSYGSVAWGDYDNDGDLDLAVTGNDWTSPRFRVYRNDNGTFNLHQEPAGAVGLWSGSVAWGDFDNDGDLDLAVNGVDESAARFRVYRNDNGTFNFYNEPAGVVGPGGNGSVAWGDFDNDGDLDLAVIGGDGGERFRIYRSFWADFRGQNLAPSIPSAGISGVYNVPAQKLEFRWDRAADAETTANDYKGLYYDIRVATKPISGYPDKWIISPSTGAGSADLGNYTHGYVAASSTQPGMNLARGLFEDTSFYWQARSIDTGLKRSTWSTETLLYVPMIPPAAVTDLSSTAGAVSDTIILNWTAPGDDGQINDISAGAYSIRYSTNLSHSWDTMQYEKYMSTATPAMALQQTPVTGLLPDVTYYFYIKTQDEITGNWSALSNKTTCYSVDANPPAAVTDLVAVTGQRGDAVGLAWSSPGDDGWFLPIVSGNFEITYSTNADFSFNNGLALISTATTPNAQNGLLLTGLIGFSTYYISLRTQDTGGAWSELSNTATGYTDGAPLTYNPAFAGITSATVRAAWGSNNNPDAQYYCEASTEASHATAYAGSGWISGVNYLFSSLSINTSFYVRVKSRVSGPADESPWLALGSTWTYAVPVSSPSLESLDSEELGSHIRIHITSMGVSGINPEYTLYAILNNDTGKWLQGDGTVYSSAAWKTIGEWETADTNLHTNLNASTVYTYRVRAKNFSGTETVISNPASVQTPSGPPGGVTVAEINDDLLRISWGLVGDALSYKIYSSSASDGQFALLGQNIMTESYDHDIDGSATQVTGVSLTPVATGQLAAGWSAVTISPSATMYYKVTTVNIGGESRLSSAAAGDREVSPELASYRVYRDDSYLISVASFTLAYTDGNLLANTSYSFSIAAMTTDEVEGSSSTALVKYTFAAAPEQLQLSNPTTYSFNIQFGPSINPAYTQYKVLVSSTDWLITAYLQQGSTIGAAAVWQSTAAWTTLITNYGPNTRYRIKAAARNGDLVESSTSTESYIHTLAVAPVPAAFTNISSASIRANWTANGNSPYTEYLSSDTITGANSGWTQNTYWDEDNLLPNTSYYFNVAARNGEGILVSTVTLGLKWTYSAVPSSPSLSSSFNVIDQYFADVVISTPDSNPGHTEYAIYGGNISEGLNWLQGSGALGGVPVWKTKQAWELPGVNRHVNLTSITEYKYRVRARNTENFETVDGTWTYIVTLPPKVTIGNVNEISDDRLRVTWGNISGALYFNVYSASATDGQYLKLSTTTNIFYEDDINGQAPNAPSGLALTTLSSTTLRLDWDIYSQELGHGATRYYCVSAQTSAGEGPASDVNFNYLSPVVSGYKIYKWDSLLYSSPSKNTTSYIDAALAPNTSGQYQITVLSSDDIEGSSCTAQKAWTFASVPDAPSLTPDWNATDLYHVNAAVQPNNNSSITEYAVTLDSGGFSNWWVQEDNLIGVNTYWAPATAWLNKGLTASTSYYYKVIARNYNNILSGLSGQSVAFTPPIPGPQNFAMVSRSTGSVTWSWTDLATEEIAYKVYSTTGGVVSGDLPADTVLWTEYGLPQNNYCGRYAKGVGPGPLFLESAPSNTTGFYTLYKEPQISVDVFASSVTVFNSFALPNTGLGNSGAYFTNSTLAVNSGWVQASSYTFTGLTPNTRYSYFMRLRNGDGIETADTAVISSYTAANVPAAPEIKYVKDTNFQLVINENSNPAATDYSIRVTTAPSGTVYYLAADSTLGTTPVYQAKALWGSLAPVTELQPSTTYYVSVNARNGDGAATAYSPVSARSTYGYAPLLTSGWNNTNFYYVQIEIVQGIYPSDMQYAVWNKDTNTWLDGLGSLTGSPVYKTKAEWDVEPANIDSDKPEPAKKYTYMARAKDNFGNLTDSSEASVYTPPAPAALESVAETADDHLNLQWSSVTGATSYKVYYSSASGDTLNLITSTTNTYFNDDIDGGSPAQVTGVGCAVQSSSSTLISWSAAAAPADSLTRYYKVRSICEGSEGAPSNEHNGTVTPVITGYNIYRNGSLIVTVPAGSVSATDAGLAAETVYNYTVSAVSSDGLEGPQSAQVTGTTYPGSYAYPEDVAGVKVVSLGQNLIKIAFSPVNKRSDGTDLTGKVKNYGLYRCSSISGNWQQVASAGADGPFEFTDNYGGLVYYYRVKAKDTYNQESDGLMIVNSDGASPVIIASRDMKVTLMFDDESKELFYNAANGAGLVRMKIEKLQDQGSGWLASYSIKAYSSSDGSLLGDDLITNTRVGAKLTLAYSSTENSISKTQPSSQQNLQPALYWNNSIKWVKVNGLNDPGASAISIRTKLIGEYAVKMVSPADKFGISSVEPKIFSPNESNITISKARFYIDNPHYSEITSAIFDIEGRVIRTSLPRELETVLYWDGRDSGGNIVPAGVYIYQLEADGNILNGTIVVAK